MKEKDMAIIGGGPAGLTAAVYAQRYGLQSVVLEKFFPGGMAATADRIENIPGIPQAERGIQWMQKLQKQAEKFGARILTGQEVQSLSPNQKRIEVITSGDNISAKSVIIASGSEHKRLNIPGENSFHGKGVSYCATCDGMFFKDKDVAVIGGGNTALQDALVLANVVRKIYVIHRRDEFRGEYALVKQLSCLENVEFVLPYLPRSIEGDNSVEKLIIENAREGNSKSLEVSAVFICVGFVPYSQPFRELVSCDEHGYIRVNSRQETIVPGIYAAGDVTDSPLKQIVTAAADGAKAAFQGYKYIQQQKLL